MKMFFTSFTLFFLVVFFPHLFDYILTFLSALVSAFLIGTFFVFYKAEKLIFNHEKNKKTSYTFDDHKKSEVFKLFFKNTVAHFLFVFMVFSLLSIFYKNINLNEYIFLSIQLFLFSAGVKIFTINYDQFYTLKKLLK